MSNSEMPFSIPISAQKFGFTKKGQNLKKAGKCPKGAGFGDFVFTKSQMFEKIWAEFHPVSLN
jgi:hypothetical protein